MMPKSKRKEKFVFLKHILEETDNEQKSAKDNDGNTDSDEISLSSANITEEGLEKQKKESSGPTGKYPVLFAKRCKNKSCQTKWSSFPLFPVPEETEWISDAEGEKRKKFRSFKVKKKQDKSKKKAIKNAAAHDHNEVEKLKGKVKNSDGTGKDFRSEHQLQDTENPVLQAWLHKKVVIARKQRRLERKERRAKKAALEEEARLKAERELESNEKVGLWLKRKKREARISWRKNRSRVGPQRGDESVLPEDSSPQVPPEYWVVGSFRQAENSPVAEKDVVDYENEKNSVNVKEMSKDPIASHSEAARKIIYTQETVEKKLPGNKANSTIQEKLKHRPKTAANHTDTLSYARPKTAGNKRPKSTKGQFSKSSDAVLANEEPSNVSRKTMQSLSYSEWLRVKQEKDKEKTIQKKRELIDSHLEAVIKELGKKRVERIMSPRKQVNTGLKNFTRSSELGQSPGPRVKKGSQYRWITSRPEPQGCDNVEIQGRERSLASSAHQTVTVGKSNTRDSNSKDWVKSEQKPSETDICQEMNAKYDQLKPSIEKVKDILDSEIKKIKETGRLSKQIEDKRDRQMVEPLQPKNKPSRPKAARPSTARPADISPKQSEKMAADMDAPSPCGSDHEASSEAAIGQYVSHDQKSTVRENYFDYGSEVDSSLTATPEFVK